MYSIPCKTTDNVKESCFVLYDNNSKTMHSVIVQIS